MAETNCICGQWLRSWDETAGGKYPPSNHAPGCPEHKLEPFSVLDLDGTRCVLEPREAEQMQADDPGAYTASVVLLTRDQFDSMPDFGGW